MLVLIVANLCLVFSLLMSAYMAVAWGEAGSFDVTGDKSSLAGFGMVPMFMAMRWLPIALVLLIAVRRGGFAFLPGGRWSQAAVVLGIHAALGYAAYRGFEAITAAIQRSDASALGSAWLFGLVLPLGVALVTGWALNREWIPRHPVWAAMLVALMLWAHIGGWRQGYRPRAAVAKHASG